MSKIREALGLGPKTDPNVTNLPEDYYDQHVEAKADEPSAPSDEPSAPSDEPMTEDEAMKAAAEKLETIELGQGSWSLIDRAMDSLSRNTGVGLDDPEAVQRAKDLARLTQIADNDLQVVLAALTEATPVTDRPGVVYSTLYRVLQQCVFFANLDYRQAEGMDAWDDDALVAEWFHRYVSSQYVDEALARVVDGKDGQIMLSADDAREKDRADEITDELGFETRREIEFAYLKERYGADEPYEAVVQSLEDVHIMFELTAHSFGWPNDRPMAYANARNPDGSFTPIGDPQTALDAQEIKRQAAKKRRAENRAAQMSAAQEAAARIIAKSLERKSVHLRK